MKELLISIILISSLQSQKIQVELDHITIITKDLEKSIQSWEEKGFTLKRKAIHKNTIHNAIIEFEAENEIELLTVREAKDDVSAFYLNEIQEMTALEKLVKVAFRMKNSTDFYKLEAQFIHSKVDYQKHDFGYAQALEFKKENPLFPFYFINFKHYQKNRSPWTKHKNGTTGIKHLIISIQIKKDLEKFLKLPSLILSENNHQKILFTLE